MDTRSGRSFGGWRQRGGGGFVEAVHVFGPLQADEYAFDARQQEQAHAEQDRRPDEGVDPKIGGEAGFDRHDRADDDVADDEHGKVGGGVVGALMMQLFAALGAGVGDLEVAGVERALAARRACLVEAALHGLPGVAFGHALAFRCGRGRGRGI